MSYCTYDDLVNAFGLEEILQLTDRDRNGRQDDDVLEEAQAFADSHIDGYLRERYSVPLANAPRNIVGIACDFVRYRLYGGEPSKTVQDRYDVGCFYLKDVARGLVHLAITPDVEVAMAYSTPTSVFTRQVWS